ncbi:MAG: putative transcriptional regulator [Frankiales bacterium]|nr:putative transcriptional regulator [Frankiales bacterium]
MDELPLRGFTVCVSSPVSGAALKDSGARVALAPTSQDLRGTRRVIDQVITSQIDCMALASRGLMTGLITSAGSDARLEAFVTALRDDVLVVCTESQVEQLMMLGIPTVVAAPADLVATVLRELPARRTFAVRAAVHELELRGHSVLVDGRTVQLTGRQAGVLSALIASGGRVLSRAELLKRAWRDEPADEHAVEMTVARLRTALGPAGTVVQTVVKRGYRLAAPVQ